MSTEREQLLKIESLYKEKKYDEFLPLAQQAAQQFPASFPVHLLYGQALVDLKKYKDAEEILLELIKSYPDNINLLLELGRLFQLQQNKDQALEYFNRILFLDPFNNQAKESIEQIDGAPTLSADDIDISREQTEVELLIPEELTSAPLPDPPEEVKPATPVPEDIPEQSFDEVLAEETEETTQPPSPKAVEPTLPDTKPMQAPETAPAMETPPSPPLDSTPPEPQPPVPEIPEQPVVEVEPAPQPEPEIVEPESTPPPSPWEVELADAEPMVQVETEIIGDDAIPEEIPPIDSPQPVATEEAGDPLAPTPDLSAQEEKPQPPTLDTESPPLDDTTPLDVIPLQEEQLSKEVDEVEDKVRQIAESEIRQTLPDAETVTGAAEEEEAMPEAEAEFVTESAAEIYLQQGHVGEALKIYEQLYQTRKDDTIMEKINKLKIRYIGQKKIDALTKFLDLIQQRS